MATERIDTPDRLVERVRSYVAARQLVRSRSLVLAAVSGGADSMAMLSILHTLSTDLDFQLAVGHFNHKLRGPADAKKERRIAADAARALGLSFHYGEADVGASALETGDSLEEAARRVRYGFLTGTAERLGAAHIATGHSRDDQAETVLMRIMRGAGIRGLAGIPTKRGGGLIIRPVLVLGRQELRAYCEKRRVPFVDDPSNTDRRFLRNRIRLDLLPLLESEYHAGVTDSLLRLSRTAEMIVQAIRSCTDPLVERAVTADGGGCIVDLAAAGFPGSKPYTTDPPAIGPIDEISIIIFFGDLFGEVLRCDTELTRPHYEQLVRLATDPLASGKMISLPGYTVTREYTTLRIRRSGTTRASGRHEDGAPRAAPEPLVLALPGCTDAPGLVVTTQILDREGICTPDLQSTGDEAYFDLHRLVPPLTLRTPSPGDRMQPFGMSGTKKLSDIFIDKKIPASRRGGTPVITDSEDILWVVGIATSEKTRVDERTGKIVKISVQKT
ncbi:MAG: tRNA lysidine(34) synthetase TilS [bacterium]